MRLLTEYLSTKGKLTIIKATDKTIRDIVKSELDRLGHDADLNHIDVSEVTKMDSLFSCLNSNLVWGKSLGIEYKDLNPDISNWKTSKVTTMERMFQDCEKFNCDIGGWDVSNVKDMGMMFLNCKEFNQDLSRWVVDNVEDMVEIFNGCESFNQDISMWNVENVEHHFSAFSNCGIQRNYKPKSNGRAWR